MAQFGRPISDVSNAWASGGFGEIDEASFNDSDFAYSADNPNDTLEVALTNTLSDPSSSSGHIVRYRYATVDGGVLSSTGTPVNLQVDLVQGTTVIATQTHSSFNLGSFTAGSFTLSGAEADSITDYTDLRLRFLASGGGGSPSNRRGVGVSWAELEIPDAPSTLDLGTGSLTPNSTLNTPILGLERPLGTVALTPDSTVNTPILGLTRPLGSIALTPDSTVNTPVLNVSGTVDLGSIALTPDSTVNTPNIELTLVFSGSLTPDSTVNTPVIGLTLDLIGSQYNTIDSYASSNIDGFYTMTTTNPIAVGQTFNGVGGAIVDRVTFYLRKNNATGSVVAKLYATSGFAPTGSPLATSNPVNTSTFSPTTEYLPVVFTFNEKILLSSGTENYAVVLEDAGDLANTFFVGRDGSSPSHNGRATYHNGTNWTSATAYDVAFLLESLNEGSSTVNGTLNAVVGLSGSLTPDSTVNTPSVDLTIGLSGALTPDSTVNTPNLSVGGTLDLGTVALTPDSTVNTPNIELTLVFSGSLTPDSTVNTPVIGLTRPLSIALTPDSTLNTPSLDLTVSLSGSLTPDSTVNTPNLSVGGTLDLGTVALTPDSTVNTPNIELTLVFSGSLTPDSTVNTPQVDLILGLSASLTPDSTVNTPVLDVSGTVDLGSIALTPDSTVNTPNIELTLVFSGSLTPDSTVNTPSLTISLPVVESVGSVNTFSSTIRNVISISGLSGGVRVPWTILKSEGALLDFNFKKLPLITLNGTDIADITSDGTQGVILAQSNTLSQPAHLNENTCQFDGIDEFLSAESGLSNIIDNNAGDAYMVVNTGAINTRKVFFSLGDKDNDNNKITFEKSSANLYRLVITISGISNPVDFGSAPADTWVVLSFSTDGATYKCFQNKVESSYSSGTNDGMWLNDITGVDSMTMGKIAQLTPVYFEYDARGVAYFNQQKNAQRNSIVTHLGNRHSVAV